MGGGCGVRGLVPAHVTNWKAIHMQYLYCGALLFVVQAVKRRADLKLIVTSATLDAVKFSSYFYEAVSVLLCPQ